MSEVSVSQVPYPHPPRGEHHFDISSVKSKPAKPAAKRTGNGAAQPSSSNPQSIPELPTDHVHVQEFKVVWSHKKKFHTVPVERARPEVTSWFNVIHTTGVVHAQLQLSFYVSMSAICLI